MAGLFGRVVLGGVLGGVFAAGGGGKSGTATGGTGGPFTGGAAGASSATTTTGLFGFGGGPFQAGASLQAGVFGGSFPSRSFCPSRSLRLRLPASTIAAPIIGLRLCAPVVGLGLCAPIIGLGLGAARARPRPAGCFRNGPSVGRPSTSPAISTVPARAAAPRGAAAAALRLRPRAPSPGAATAAPAAAATSSLRPRAPSPVAAATSSLRPRAPSPVAAATSSLLPRAPSPCRFQLLSTNWQPLWRSCRFQLQLRQSKSCHLQLPIRNSGATHLDTSKKGGGRPSQRSGRWPASVPAAGWQVGRQSCSSWSCCCLCSSSSLWLFFLPSSYLSCPSSWSASWTTCPCGSSSSQLQFEPLLYLAAAQQDLKKHTLLRSRGCFHHEAASPCVSASCTCHMQHGMNMTEFKPGKLKTRTTAFPSKHCPTCTCTHMNSHEQSPKQSDSSYTHSVLTA